MPIRVFNADDHPILRKGVTDLIIDTPNLEWVGSAENGEEALEKIRTIKPDIAILDIEMPKLSGIEAARQLIADSVNTSIILLTLFKDEALFNNAVRMGVKGYLLKESSTNEIVDCIYAVYAGRFYTNSTLTHMLVNQSSQESDVLSQLTKHEINILKLISYRKTSSEIADMLFISPKTVANHRSNISKKLNLDGQQNGLLIWALEHKDELMKR
jgi:DNA-binding NarL/FixJ family response regulator